MEFRFLGVIGFRVLVFRIWGGLGLFLIFRQSWVGGFVSWRSGVLVVSVLRASFSLSAFHRLENHQQAPQLDASSGCRMYVGLSGGV